MSGTDAPSTENGRQEELEPFVITIVLATQPLMTVQLLMEDTNPEELVAGIMAAKHGQNSLHIGNEVIPAINDFMIVGRNAKRTKITHIFDARSVVDISIGPVPSDVEPVRRGVIPISGGPLQ